VLSATLYFSTAIIHSTRRDTTLAANTRAHLVGIAADQAPTQKP